MILLVGPQRSSRSITPAAAVYIYSSSDEANWLHRAPSLNKAASFLSAFFGWDEAALLDEAIYRAGSTGSILVQQKTITQYIAVVDARTYGGTAPPNTMTTQAEGPRQKRSSKRACTLRSSACDISNQVRVLGCCGPASATLHGLLVLAATI